MQLTKSKTILVCPLDWGLGHATRMVPIIDLLLKKGASVIIGADNRPLAYLRLRFPGCEFVKFPGYQPKYPETGSMALAMLKAFPEMRKEAKIANRLLQELIVERNIDVVISDNRYELSTPKAYSVFVTHQLSIKTPGVATLAKPVIQQTINTYIKKYDELWIPDVEGAPNLSGVLSHGNKMPVENYHFIGPLSRFSLFDQKRKTKKVDLLILLSGPEPQRTLLEEMLIKQALNTDYSTVVLQGKPECNGKKKIENVSILPHGDDAKMAELILGADHIICRPGYSTIMDLAILGKKAIFIPTPGQTEQEYLAAHFKMEGTFYCEKQSDFELDRAIINSERFNGELNISSANKLSVCLESLLSN